MPTMRFQGIASHIMRHNQTEARPIGGREAVFGCNIGMMLTKWAAVIVPKAFNRENPAATHWKSRTIPRIFIQVEICVVLLKAHREAWIYATRLKYLFCRMSLSQNHCALLGCML
jgi:hypothetical protein